MGIYRDDQPEISVHKYILDANNQPVICDDVYAWGQWFEAGDDRRRVARTDFDGGYVSTVFLGLDHNFTHGEPILWETMIFGGPHDAYCERYASHAAAVLGHRRAVMLALAADAVDPPAGSTGTPTTRV